MFLLLSKLQNQLQVGDIILETQDMWFSKLIRFFTKSKFSHACLYVGGGQIVEASVQGVKQVGLKKYEDKKYRLGFVRPTFVGEEADHLVWLLKGLVGHPYDYPSLLGYVIALVASKLGFYIKNPFESSYSYACSELVAKALALVNEKLDVRDLAIAKDYALVAPQTFIDACQARPQYYTWLSAVE